MIFKCATYDHFCAVHECAHFHNHLHYCYYYHYYCPHNHNNRGIGSGNCWTNSRVYFVIL